MTSGILTIPLSGRISGSGIGPDAPFPLFEFVAGPENHLAVTAVRPFLDGAKAPWSPLVLYGPHGSGKSHLAHGLARWWRERLEHVRVACMPASQFAQEYALAVAQDGLDRWRREARSVDFLVMEDLGHLADKPGAQQELIQTLDALADRGATVVVTARVLPAHSGVLMAGLRSRLSLGLSVPLALPGQAARRAIAERIVENLDLPKQVVRALADHLTATVPSLAAALVDLDLAAKVAGRAVDTSAVRRFIADRQRVSTPSLTEIAGKTAKYFGLKVAELKSAERRQPLVAARGIAMHLARQLTDKSFGQIGAFFGGRDHTTVIHGCRRTEKQLRGDRATRQAVADLKRLLSAT